MSFQTLKTFFNLKNALKTIFNETLRSFCPSTQSQGNQNLKGL